MNGPTTEHLIETIGTHARGGLGDAVALRWWSRPIHRVRADRVPHDHVREELTYRELLRRVEATADALHREGLRAGDRVLFSVRPRPEGIVLALAVVRLGGVIVFVDPGSTPELFGARVTAADPRWAMTEALLYAISRGPLRHVARSRGLLLPDYASLPLRHVHSGRRLPGVPGHSLSARSLATGRHRGGRRRFVAGAPPVTDLPLDAEALVVFTSGTTSDPKAVVHSVGSLGSGCALLAGAFSLEPGGVVHTDQMLLGIPALLAGGTWSVPPGTPGQDVVTFARHAAGEAGTYLVPADLTLLLDAVESGRAPARGPQVALVGGAPVTRPLLDRARRLLPGTRWIGVYGTTEILPVAVVEADDKLAHAGDGDLVGLPLAGIEATIDTSAVEPDEDGSAPGRAPVPALHPPVGELVLRGPSLMTGYLSHLDGGQPPVTEHRTGDLAYLDERGRIVLVGRTRDMIIRGTVNIYPGLFEPRLAALPGVGEASLVGVLQDDGDEKVVLVVTSSTEGGPGTGDPRRAGDPDGDGDGSGGVDAEGAQVPRTSSAAAAPATPATGAALAPAVSAAVGQGEGPVLTGDHPLVRTVRAALPGVLDHGALPDHVLHADRLPLAGRSRKPDRAALSRAAAHHLAGAAPGASASTR
ncbi:class I adenylate-forming enzyme family protein [Oerskovia enterophila]|uniref:Long-chain-fatty-acid--CoA ligase n=1 Tax=Oerskovia enterophila TaxID=43678 RepID=A0A161XI11_9CELL|nr:class I adenylate-forming enzyme family protein [Oerskovia enterophila]KZM36457.1 long-chain-fatty-acid--CoA ligase [Oerskovia enterophila]OCI29989.1 long-chain-fatty-acid--CoA ligase [Oerskovia enterophila]